MEDSVNLCPHFDNNSNVPVDYEYYDERFGGEEIPYFNSWVSSQRIERKEQEGSENLKESDIQNWHFSENLSKLYGNTDF